jgi:hypothetical protein
MYLVTLTPCPHEQLLAYVRYFDEAAIPTCHRYRYASHDVVDILLRYTLGPGSHDHT